MARYTENFNLIKPDDEDYYDVADFNENMDIIDEALALSVGGAEAADKIGQPEDSILSTVFGKLNGFISPDGKGVRIIKSIQHISIELLQPTMEKTVPISPVDSSRCIVIAEARTPDINFYYSFTDTELTAGYRRTYTANCYLAFWIIEFY